MSTALRGYLLAVAAAGAAFELGLWLVAPGNLSDQVPLAVVLIAAAAVAANFPVAVSPRYKADLSPALYFACALLFPPAAAGALVGISRLIGEGTLCLRRNPDTGKPRRDVWSLAFNGGQIVLATAGAAISYHLLLSNSTGAGSKLASVCLSAAVMYALSTFLVVTAVGVQKRRNPFAVWIEVGRIDLFQNAALFVAGYILATVAAGRFWMVPVVMLPVVAVQLSLKRSVQLAEQTVAAVEAMADVVDTRDPYTFRHSTNVAAQAAAISRQLRLPEAEAELIRLAARVHDLGKIGVPDSVLHKEGRLTPAEFELMKMHPQIGADILSRYPLYKRGRQLVLAHHERFDGLGYPNGLRADQIPMGARVIAVADAWDAMTSDRPYRRALDASVALAELDRGRGAQWDPRVVDAFVEVVTGRPRSTAIRSPRPAAAPAIRALGAVVGILGG